MSGQLVEIMKFEDMELMAYQDKSFGYAFTTADVAKGYGCAEATIRRHLQNHSDELIEGKHFNRVQILNAVETNGTVYEKLFWSPRGVIRLGMFIRSEQAKRFRNWAEDVLLIAIDPNSGFTKGQRLRDVTEFMKRVAEACKVLRLSRYEAIVMANSMAEYELGYPLMPFDKDSFLRGADEFLVAIRDRRANFFDYLSAIDQYHMRAAFMKLQINQPFLIAAYKAYVGRDATSRAVMDELRASSEWYLGESKTVNGIRSFRI